MCIYFIFNYLLVLRLNIITSVMYRMCYLFCRRLWRPMGVV